MDEEQIKKLRNFVYYSIVRYHQDMNSFFPSVISQNPGAFTGLHDDLIAQFKDVADKLQIILDYSFFEDPYIVEIDDHDYLPV